MAPNLGSQAHEAAMSRAVVKGLCLPWLVWLSEMPTACKYVFKLFIVQRNML
jgi:hypothetical protein